MKEVLGFIVIILSGLSAVLGVIGGAVLLRTWWIAFAGLFVAKIVIWGASLAVTLSWWTVFLVPLGMFVGGFLFIGLGIVVGMLLAIIIDSL